MAVYSRDTGKALLPHHSPKQGSRQDASHQEIWWDIQFAPKRSKSPQDVKNTAVEKYSWSQFRRDRLSCNKKVRMGMLPVRARRASRDGANILARERESQEEVVGEKVKEKIETIHIFNVERKKASRVAEYRRMFRVHSARNGEGSQVVPPCMCSKNEEMSK